MPAAPTGQEQIGISFGTSALFELMCWARFGYFSFDRVILLHPIALAAWYGLFVTALNLLPIGQLDGGHVLYALLGPRRAPIGSFAVLVCLIPLGILLWPGWLFFGVLVTVLGWRHPPPLDPYTPLDRGARLIGCATVILFLLIFIPIPISL
jgi:membrane-associated protease RseP (regulator of RpoE activity)